MKFVLPQSVLRTFDFGYMQTLDGIALIGDNWVQDRLADKAYEYQGRVIAFRASGVTPNHPDAWKLWDSVCKLGVAQDVLERGRTRRGLARQRCLSGVESILAEEGAEYHASQILDQPHPRDISRSIFENAYKVIQQYVKNRGCEEVRGGTGF